MSENPTNTLETHDADKAERIDAQPELTSEKKPILAIVIGALILVGLIVGLFFLARAEGQVVS